ncbi:MAG: hypothetical protein KatS3mg129_0566 [Leptospiraceae bacterium]|nr:MAG: hypothetical protein KatS3mg129_0566 [Leptospiraceae bacterium]
MNQLREYLSQFKEDDYTVKLLSTIFNIVPIDVQFQFYNQFEDGLRRVRPDISQEEIQKAYEKLNDENIQSALKAFSYVDTSDKLIAGYAGIKNVLNLFGMGNSQKRTFESDPQQALDAGVKALVIAYATNKLYTGDISNKINKLRNTPAGLELLIYYALIEIALPFTDNLIEGSANTISKLFKNQNEIQNKFNSLGIGNIENVSETINSMQSTLSLYLDKVKSYTGPVAEKIKAYLPSAMNIADSATGAVATGADLLPVWTFLGARLVAEAIAKEL